MGRRPSTLLTALAIPGGGAAAGIGRTRSNVRLISANSARILFDALPRTSSPWCRAKGRNGSCHPAVEVARGEPLCQYLGVSSDVTYTRLLEDQEMRAHLEERDMLLFEGLGRQWQRIERQIERLGFAELYVVSQRGSRPGSTKVTPVASSRRSTARSAKSRWPSGDGDLSTASALAPSARCGSTWPAARSSF